MFWMWWIYFTLKKQQKMLLTGWPSHLLYNTAQTIPGSSFKLLLVAAPRRCMTQPALNQPAHRKGRSRWTSGQGVSQFCGKTKSFTSDISQSNCQAQTHWLHFSSSPECFWCFTNVYGTSWIQDEMSRKQFYFQIWSPVSHLLKLSGKCHDFLFIFYLLANNKLYKGKKGKKKAKA